ncbi:family 43 glycosylhydrolase [Cryobacterium zhongshanensis]|uniref:Family 43 glycosylhydrolase n=1 Tax=Cryobacterium zhongshanensis TaxID=2928153 RepID=A0AA41QTX2_9MICO|nr:family 43 glycosylhydrolase [Cryobacterium zhongshanensis]MCI4656907.1 family 43 glycosylhydrolase [Cryobacterium zhongshanensis]
MVGPTILALTASLLLPLSAAASPAAEARPGSAPGATLSITTTTAAPIVAPESGLNAIHNDRFWYDTAGNPIYSQGGGVFRFGDTYYWYGVRYTGSESYFTNPTKIYGNTARDVKFVAITAYSSRDLVNWTFEGNVATPETALAIPASKDVSSDYFSRMTSLNDASWLGRLGVVYNENTGKYVLLTQMETSFDPVRDTNAAVLSLESDTPTGPFHYANLQTKIQNTPVQGTGDQTVFTDDDGTDYLVFSSRNGRKYSYVSKISDADSLSVEPAVQVGYVGAGREGNAMFKLDGRYYIATSDLHGWNSSVTHVISSSSADIQGAYSAEYTLPGTEKDYSHVTQTGFFVTVTGTTRDTVIYAGDRWADFAWNGLGYNQWLPLSAGPAGLNFESLSDWNLNATTGEWTVGSGNNYVLNPDFAADRVAVTQVTGWTTTVDPGSATSQFVTNPSPGGNATRFALRLGSAGAFSGSVSQQVTVPAGVYGFALSSTTTDGLDHARVRIAGAAGEDYVLDLGAAAGGWSRHALENLTLAAGTVTVSIEAGSAGAGQCVTVDGLSLTPVDSPVWEPESSYRGGDRVTFAGSLWTATWSTTGQTPGDPNGSWQETLAGSNGTAVWTPSRIFVAGDVVASAGIRYTAKWWTRNQAPGDPYGPWAPQAG